MSGPMKSGSSRDHWQRGKQGDDRAILALKPHAAKHGLRTTGWISEGGHIGWEKLFEVTVGKSLRVVFASHGVAMSLVRAIPVVPEFMHEDMEQDKRSRLRFGEATNDGVFAGVEGYAQTLDQVTVLLEVTGGQRNPQILVPSAQENGPSLLPMVKLMVSILVAVAGAQDDTLQAMG